MKVCIDPGHNSFGVDTGAQGNGLREQDLTLDIAKRLKPLLEQNGIEVVMTREGGTVGGSLSSVTDSLRVRCNVANQAKADLFVSIHINAGGGTGTEVYALPGGRAAVAAGKVLYYLVQSCGWANRGVKSANDYVLVNTDMPAILTENGFIDTTSDAEKLKIGDFLQGIAKAHAHGICEYFGIGYRDVPAPQPTPQPTPQPQPTTGTPILGTEAVTVEQCTQFIRKVNPNAPDLAPIYERIGKAMGIKWGYAFAQMIKETGYLKFGGDVKPEQNNFAGIGATGGVGGASFVNAEYGVAAHLQHLFAYASTQPLPSNILKVDPRFDLVKRGLCLTWESLNGHWAVPGVGYGEDIVKIHDAIAKEQIVSDSTSLLKKILQLILDYFKGVN